MHKALARSILEEILENKKKEVEIAEELHPLSHFFGSLTKSKCGDLSEIFPEDRLNVIGEIKRKSPFSRQRFSYDAVELASLYSQYCSAISVLTDRKYFGTDLDDLASVRAASDLPILRKEFIIDEYQIHEARLYGSDIVLFIASVLSHSQLENFLGVTKKYHMHGLVEIHDGEDLQKALEVDAKLIGINNRDLRTGEIDLSRTSELAPRIIKNGAYVVSESGVRSREDVERIRYDADGILIGEGILSSNDPEQKLKELTSEELV